MHANTRRSIINRTFSVALVLASVLSLATVCVGQVAFRSLSAQTTNGANSLQLFKPPLTATGDLMIAAVVVDDGSFSGRTWTVPSGWTELDIGNCPNEPPRRCSMGVWWKIVPPGEGGSFDFDWGGTADPASGTILSYSGTDDSFPIGAVATDSGVHKANSSDPPVAPSVTTTASDTVVLRIKGNDREGGIWTGDASHTTLLNGCNPDTDPDLVCLTVADQSQAVAGSAGSMTWLPAPNLTNLFWRSLSIEIQPPQPRGDIRVTKYVLPDSGVDVFDFTATGLDPGSFDLMRGQSREFPALMPGSGLYSVSETVPEDFTRISHCDIGHTGNIEVVDGMTTQCTFVNIDESQVPRCDMVGAIDNSIGSGGNYSFAAGLEFDAVAPFVLRAVDVYPNAAGDVIVNLKKDGALLASRSVAVNPSVPGEKTRIELDLPVPAGFGYYLDNEGSSTGGLYRNSSGPSYPYIGEFLAITGSPAGLSFYYFFYDWEVERMDAVGPATKEFGGGSYHEGIFQMEFDTSEPTRIHSVHVYPESAGDVAIQLLDSADVVVDSVIRNVPASLIGAKTPIVLDFLVSAGDDWALKLNTTTTTTRLWRNNSGSVFPFSTSTLSMTGHTFGNQAYYYYFYDWLFTPARLGWDVHLHDLTVDSAMAVRACGTATLGPDMDLVFPADVDVQAGESIVLESPFESGDNVLFGMAIDPALLPD